MGGKNIAGADEAGRGSLFGPIFAAAVLMRENDFIEGVKDSKKLTPKKREILFNEIMDKAEDISVAFESNFVIDKINIHKANLNVLKNSILNLREKPDIIYVDGFYIKDLPLKHTAVIKGDEKIPVISAASIVAKVLRDRLMVMFSNLFPEYSIDKHKGYGTKKHREALIKYGKTIFHRESFNFGNKRSKTYGRYQ
jgi:ribonuclease HII